MDKTLEEGYTFYRRQLEEAVIEGQLQTPELARRYGFPRALMLTEAEQMEVERFVLDRVEDLFTEFMDDEEVHPLTIGHFLMNSVLSGMMWEQERDVETASRLNDLD